MNSSALHIDWMEKIEATKSKEIKRNSIKVLKLILQEILVNFRTPVAESLVKEIQRKIPQMARAEALLEFEEGQEAETRTSFAFPIEYKEKRTN